jgi:transcriptional regulator of acetoin/glycerol metabolism
MNSKDNKDVEGQQNMPEKPGSHKADKLLSSNIGDSIDLLVEYLVDNNIKGIHPLIMGEVEKRLIIKTLEKSRGNKLQAAKILGMSRNTFHRKVQKLENSDQPPNNRKPS